MVFCNYGRYEPITLQDTVTILILIDGFLQYDSRQKKIKRELSHNPYFNRWFSAMNNTDFMNLYRQMVTILILIDGFLQCVKMKININNVKIVTILILIDGFLQYI